MGMDRRARREQMRGWIEVRLREGLTFRALSERSGIPVKTLHRWHARFREEKEGLADHGSSRASAFVELIDAERAAPSRIEIVLKHDRRVIVWDDFDPSMLVRVVRALEQC